MSTNVQDYVELLNAEQHVQVDKLREHARHGVAPRVRGEVWMYLLNVMSEDKTAEITSLISLRKRYQSLSSNLPSSVTSLLLKTALDHHTKRFNNPTYASLITSITAEQPLSRDGSIRGGGHQTSRSLNPSSVANSSGSGTSPSIVSKPHQPPSQSNHPILPPPMMSNTNSSKSPQTIPPTTSQPERHTPSQHHPEQEEDDPSNSENEDDERTNLGSTQLSSRPQSFLSPPPTSPPTRHGYLTILEEVLGKFWNDEENSGRGEDWRKLTLAGLLDGSERDWVYLCTPFLCCLSQPVAVFCGFQKLMERIYTFPPLPSRLATLLTLFRLALPELQSYFEDEQVPFYQVAVCWLKSLLSREMWLGDVLRLWDAYLASDDMFALHCYVCVAILGTCKETLEELDGSEAKLMLLDLPPMDVDRLLQDAANLRVSFPLPRPVMDL